MSLRLAVIVTAWVQGLWTPCLLFTNWPLPSNPYKYVHTDSISTVYIRTLFNLQCFENNPEQSVSGDMSNHRCNSTLIVFTIKSPTEVVQLLRLDNSALCKLLSPVVSWLETRSTGPGVFFLRGLCISTHCTIPAIHSPSVGTYHHRHHGYLFFQSQQYSFLSPSQSAWLGVSTELVCTCTRPGPTLHCLDRV